jgi:hypothetical protein
VLISPARFSKELGKNISMFIACLLTATDAFMDRHEWRKFRNHLVLRLLTNRSKCPRRGQRRRPLGSPGEAVAAADEALRTHAAADCELYASRTHSES